LWSLGRVYLLGVPAGWPAPEPKEIRP